MEKGDVVDVHISNRADFVRVAQVLSVWDKDALVRYANGEREIVPRRWIE